MAITGIIRPGHVQLRVLDIEAAVRHYRDVIGLIETARDPPGRIYLKAWDEHDHHSVVLREADTAGMDFMGFRVDSPATLAKLAADVKASGLATDMQWIEAGEPGGVNCTTRKLPPTPKSASSLQPRPP